MKSLINLARIPSRHERYGLAWSIPVVLIAAVCLVVFSIIGIRNIREYRAIQNDLSRLGQRLQQSTQRESVLKNALNEPSFREVSNEAQYINSLIAAKQFSAADLVWKVSKLMPSAVRLSSMSVVAKEGPTVQFSIVARDEQAVEAFLTALEDSPDFRDVTMVDQGFNTSGPEEGPVTVTCSARYVGILVK